MPMPWHDAPRPTLTAALAAALALVCLAAGCSSEDVTGEPEEIQALVEVVGRESECVHDPGAEEVAVRVRLRNTGEDDRTVRVTPVLGEGGGDETEFSLDSTEVTVPGARGGGGPARPRPGAGRPRRVLGADRWRRARCRSALR